MNRQLLFLLLAAAAITSSAKADPSAYSGVLEVASIQGQPGQQIAVDIRIRSSNEPVAGMELPLQFEGPFTLDSVSFVGSLITDKFIRIVSIDNAADTVTIYAVPDIFGADSLATIPQAAGLLARLHFTVDTNAPSGFHVIDSVLRSQSFGSVTLWKRCQFSNKEGQTILPGFEDGGITVQIPTGLDDEPSNLPTSFSVAQNYPNPFNPTTQIEFSLPAASDVRIEVFNILGQNVATLADRRYQAGVHSVTFDAANQPSGVYLYRVVTEYATQTHKMLLLK